MKRQRRRKAAPVDAVVLYESPAYLARLWQVGTDRLAVVCFANWLPAPTLGGVFPGEAFFTRRGISFIGIEAARNDWYQGADMPLLVAAIRAATPGRRLVGYGGSMGAYAAINYAHDLGLASLVAVSPQVSIDPAKAPFEMRWLAEAGRIAFDRDRIENSPPIPHGYLLYDPVGLDARHAERILARHPLTPVRIGFAGHHTMLALQQMDLYGGLVLDLLAGRHDAAALQMQLRRRRRRSPVAWMQLSATLRGRGNAREAVRAAQRSLALKAREPRFPLALNAAHAFIANGQRLPAAMLLHPYLDDPDFAVAMPWFCRELGMTAEEMRDLMTLPEYRVPRLRERLRFLFDRARR